MEIITGKTGRNHITSADDGQLHALMVGKGVFVLNSNANFSAELIDNNTLRIHSGDILMDGRHGRIRYGEYEDLAIDSGMEGYKRKDYIVVRYENNDGIESMTLNVEKGESTTGACPFYNVVDGDITKGATVKEFLMYEVYLDGTATPQIARFFEITEIQPAKKSIYDDELVNFGRKEGSAIGERSVALGKDVEASGFFSHAEGNNTKASEQSSHAEGSYTSANGLGSHAEGLSSKAIGEYSHAEGYCTTASGDNSHAEGNGTNAVGGYSHAEGGSTTASGLGSHAEGNNTKASEQSSHAEGSYTTASGLGSHAEGLSSKAIGEYSHAEGYCTTASGQNQHVQGKFNVEDTENKYAHIVGGGDSSARKNIHTLDWEGNAEYAGDVTAHDADGNEVSLVDSAISKTTTGKIVTLNDSTDAPIISLKSNGYTEQQTYSGKNLMKVEKSGNSWQCDVSVADDGKITLTNTATTGVAYGRVGLITFKANTTYTISVHNASNLKDITFFKPGVSESAKIAYTHSNVTVTPSSDVEAELIVYMNDISASNKTTSLYIQIEEGDKATTYEPYTGGIASPNPDYPQEIKALDKVSVKTCGKNLLKNSATSQTLYGVTYVVNEDGSIVANGTATAYAFLSGNVTLPKGTYIYTGCPSGGGNEKYNQMITIDDGATFKFDTGSGCTFTLTKETKVTWYSGRIITGQTVSNLTFYPMIRNANIEDATYEPYTETLAEIDLTEPLYEGDYIEYRADGTGVLHRKMAKVVFDGSSDETWNMLGEDTSRRFAMTAFANYKDKKNTVRSSHFVKSDVYSWAGMPDCSCLNADNMLGFKYLSLTTLAEYKTWLQSNPVTVVYELAEPQEIELTAEQLAQLKQLRTFDTITNILCDGETTTQYYKDNANGECVVGLQEKLEKAVETLGFVDVVTGMNAWTKGGSTGSGILRSVVYGRDMFVAVGAAGKTYLSYNGSAWFTVENAGSSNLVSVVYGNYRFVAVGEGGAYYSENGGVTWKKSNGIDSTSLYAVTYGNGKFVTVGAGGKTFHSKDGVNWVAGSNAGSGFLGYVAYGNGKFVTATTSGDTYYSTDGITWTTGEWFSMTTCVCFGNGRFVVAQKKATNVYNTYISTDGINWVASTNNMNYGLISIYCGDGVFVGVNSNYEMYSSYDGLTWNLIADSNDTAYAVAYGNGKFVTVGAGDTYCTKLQKETKSLKDVINELYSLLK